MTGLARTVARACWRHGWIACLPLVALSVAAFVRAHGRFVGLGIGRDTSPYVLDLGACIREEGERLLRDVRLALTPARSSALRTVRIEVDRAALARLDADPPYSGREAVHATLAIEGGDAAVAVRDVELRRRGDTYGHWGRAKRSMRVRTGRDARVEGMRTFHLIAPETDAQIENHLGYRLAREVGLLAPISEFVHVTVNGEDQGVFELTEDVDEGFLRRRGWTSEPILEGDLIGRDAWAGIPNDVFGNAGLWDVHNADGRSIDEIRAPLEELVDLVSGPLDEARAERLVALVDLRAFARLSLVEALTQSNHLDGSHNWKLLWNEWRGVFEPILWDPNGWLPGMCPAEGEPLDVHPVFQPLADRLHSLVPFLAVRDEVWREFYAAGGGDALLAALDDVLATTRGAFAADPCRVPANDGRWERATAELVARIRRIVRELEAAVVDPAAALEWQRPTTADGVLRLRTASARPLANLVVALRGTARPARVVLVAGPVTPEVDLGARVRGTATGVEIDCVLAADLATHVEFRPPDVTRNHRRLVRAATWDLRLEGVDARDVTGVLADGDRVFVERDVLRSEPARELFLAGALGSRSSVTLAGELAVAADRRFDAHVTILPGTTFRLAPGASLEFRGGLDARGRPDAPIRFVRAVADRPWGVVRVAGAACRGATLAGCRLDGGSRARIDRVECTAMLSIHGVASVVLRDVVVRGATDAEDAVHVAWSEVECEQLVVEDAVADGIDSDASDLILRGGRFVRCGNDGIDLMASRAIVRGVTCQDCGDKGLSIGEGSRALIAGSVLERCTTGLEVRDASRVTWLHGEVRGSAVAVRAMVKDPRYAAGGHVDVLRTAVRDCGALGAADPASSLAFGDCRIEGLAADAAPGVRCEACDPGAASVEPAPEPPAHVAALGPEAMTAWRAQLRPERGPRSDEHGGDRR